MLSISCRNQEAFATGSFSGLGDFFLGQSEGTPLSALPLSVAHLLESSDAEERSTARFLTDPIFRINGETLNLPLRLSAPRCGAVSPAPFPRVHVFILLCTHTLRPRRAFERDKQHSFDNKCVLFRIKWDINGCLCSAVLDSLGVLKLCTPVASTTEEAIVSCSC